MIQSETCTAENRIKAILADQKRTSRWLAEYLNVSQNTISRWCSNKGQPSLALLGNIANALNVDIRDLLRPTKQEL